MGIGKIIWTLKIRCKEALKSTRKTNNNIENKEKKELVETLFMKGLDP